jgi:hypothetical protein
MMRFDANEKREEIPEATSIRGARWRLEAAGGPVRGRGPANLV